MALFLFTKAILARKPIDVFNHGEMRRDFTYIDDIIEGLIRVMRIIPAGKSGWDGIQSGVSPAPARIYNIGNGAPCRLLDFIQALETDTGYRPNTSLQEGIKRFVAWYREYYSE
jgi:UDP-glucuronate 4-epimerase